MTRKAWLPLLLSFYLFLLPATCWASETAERTFLITEGELARLEGNLTRQADIISRLRTELTTLRLNGEEARKALAGASISLEIMRRDLALLKTDLANSENSLRRANLSLEEYGKETKAKSRILKNQRNVWAAVCVLLLAALAGSG